jgi:hypothetical protein
MMRSTYYLLPALAIVAVVGASLSGCLVSGTKVFSENLGDINATSSSSPNQTTLDLTDNSTWEDYKDEIRNIDRVGFTTTVRENIGNSVSISMYFSARDDLGSAQQVIAEATPLFLNFVVPANSRQPISYAQSQLMILNIEELKTLVEGGQLSFYTLSTHNFNVTLEEFIVTVTFTVGI